MRVGDLERVPGIDRRATLLFLELRSVLEEDCERRLPGGSSRSRRGTLRGPLQELLALDRGHCLDGQRIHLVADQLAKTFTI